MRARLHLDNCRCDQPQFHGPDRAALDAQRRQARAQMAQRRRWGVEQRNRRRLARQRHAQPRSGQAEGQDMQSGRAPTGNAP